jgi:hypothetical protein
MRLGTNLQRLVRWRLALAPVIWKGRPADDGVSSPPILWFWATGRWMTLIGYRWVGPPIVLPALVYH